MSEFPELPILNLKEERSDHYARQGLHKPGDRAKKYNSKSVPSTPKGQLKALKGRVRSGVGPVHIREGETTAEGGVRLKSGSVLGGMRDEADGEVSDVDKDDGGENISTPKPREVPLEELITIGAKKPRKPKGLAKEYDRIRNIKNQSRSGSNSNSSSHTGEEEWEDDWDSVNETEEGWGEEYSEEWRNEMGDLLSATALQSNKPSYASAVLNRSGEIGASDLTSPPRLPRVEAQLLPPTPMPM